MRQRFAALAERANLATEWEWHNRFGENYLLEKSIILGLEEIFYAFFLVLVWMNA